jgi:hypothetical protein
MRNNGLAKISENTNYPYNGTGIYIKGKTISYESCSFGKRRIFVNFRFIKLKMKYRRIYRKEAEYYGNKNMEYLSKMSTERIKTLNNEINILLKEIKEILNNRN